MDIMYEDKFCFGLMEMVGEEAVLRFEPLSRHTSFKIGGPAKYFVEPKSIPDVMNVLSFSKRQGVPWAVIGNGTNLLVSDDGFDGMVVCISKRMRGITVEGEYIYVQAGAFLSSVAREALNNGLSGLEFAGGIPGTIGGAVVMNAGAYGKEMADVIESVEILDKKGNVKTLKKDELLFGYRTSIIPKEEFIVLSATIKLKKSDDVEGIKSLMQELLAKRKEKQPLEYPSAGSTFKRPEGYFAGKLIEDAGLKGFSIGGACISEKHGGFVINKGGATAKDVTRLIEHVKKTVFEKFGVELEPEIKLLGFGERETCSLSH